MLEPETKDQTRGALSLESGIQALYLGVLGRPADPGGLEYHLDLLQNRDMTLEDIAIQMHECDEHNIVMGRPPGIADHSQHGELAQILKAIMRKGSRYDIVVDAGARGRDRSNSYDLLAQFGWHGVLIEANPALLPHIRREFDGLHFDLVGCAVGTENGRLPFYIGVNDDVSSLVKGASQAWGDIKGVVEVEVRRLHEILQERNIPYDFDLLSIDIESMDMPVFNDLITSSAYRPSVVIMEIPPELDRTSMKNIGGNEIVCANYEVIDLTPSNVIAIRK